MRRIGLESSLILSYPLLYAWFNPATGSKADAAPLMHRGSPVPTFLGSASKVRRIPELVPLE